VEAVIFVSGAGDGPKVLSICDGNVTGAEAELESHRGLSADGC
jgi:hypothetical protein